MDNSIAIHFNTLHGIRMQEITGNHIIDIEPVSFCIFDNEMPTNSQHYHNFYELCIVTGGIGEYLHGREKYRLAEGDVFIANPGVMHEIRLLKEETGKRRDNLYLVFFNINIQGCNLKKPENYEEERLASFFTYHNIVRKSCRQILSYLSFFKTYMEYNSKISFGVYNAVKGMAMDCLFSLVGDGNNQIDGNKQIIGKANPAASILDTAIKYVNANLSEKLYLKDIAGNSHTSSRNLQLLFQKNIKKTVSEYILDRRMSLAAGYLKMNFRISDVCPIVGINDPAHFSRLFKRFYGISPKKYQMIYSSLA